jgi:hypothetical protein
MRRRSRLRFALLLTSLALSQPSASPAPETVVVGSGELRLQGFLWMQEALQREHSAPGDEAGKRRQLVLPTRDHLEQLLAGLWFLKQLPGPAGRSHPGEGPVRAAHTGAIVADSREGEWLRKNHFT